MLQRATPTFGEQLSSGIERGLERGHEFNKMAYQGKLQSQSQERQFAQEIEKELLKNKQKMELLSSLGLFPTDEVSEGDTSMGSSLGPIGSSRKISDEKLAALSLIEPNLAKVLQEQQKTGRQEFESERGYHTSFSKPIEEHVAKLRDAIPRKESALNLARNAIETGNLGFFSKDKLADITGQDVFRTAKGAQLITAGKENLLNNMGRVSARAQNIWFEQRLNSMFPKIGQSREANLTVQEMIEGELALDKLYQSEYDRMSKADEDRYGFVRKDIDKRVRDAIRPQEKEVFKRTVFRIKELEEQEKGIESLRKLAGKNVSPGTPLTLAMANIYHKKFGDNALTVAKKNGYYIPTAEEFKIFKSNPLEFREGFEE